MSTTAEIKEAMALVASAEDKLHLFCNEMATMLGEPVLKKIFDARDTLVTALTTMARTSMGTQAGAVELVPAPQVQAPAAAAATVMAMPVLGAKIVASAPTGNKAQVLANCCFWQMVLIEQFYQMSGNMVMKNAIQPHFTMMRKNLIDAGFADPGPLHDPNEVTGDVKPA